jgi:thioredoxin reductase (NADPH)
MFPRLDAAQIQRLASIGRCVQVPAGQVLFAQGEKDVHFFIVVRGGIEVISPRGDGGVQVITVHGPGQFTGEMTMLARRRSLVSGRTTADSEIIVLSQNCLRTLVQTDAELSEIIMRAFILRRVGLIANNMGDVILIGSSHSAGTLRLKEFLTRNAHPHLYLDVEHDATVQELLDRFHFTVQDVPVVICRNQSLMRNPSNEEVAECLGLNAPLDEKAVRDVIVIGAGPAGLAAAVYAASEGLDVLVLDCNAPGGQAGSSSKIENYLGFPTGISGQALAGRAYSQAQKFGAEVAIARHAAQLHCEQRPYVLTLEGGGTVKGRAVIIASGVRYHRLPLADLSRFEGVGIYYAATYVESQLCGGEEIIIVGGANSAGQAAVFLARSVKHVHMLVRSGGLSDSMSRYLIRRIEETPNITLHRYTQIEELHGGDSLESVRWRNSQTGEVRTQPIRHVFLMTGASPNTAWLQGCVALDGKGFVKTGADLLPEDLSAARWPLPRPPGLFETSLPSVFAVGDVRSGSTKRVAAAVGEGSICIQLVHRALAE